MKHGNFIFWAAITATVVFVLGTGSAMALTKKEIGKLNQCRSASSSLGRVAKTIKGRIVSFENRLAEFRTKPYTECKGASDALDESGSELYFAITHSDRDKLPNKAAGDKTRKAKDDLVKAYKSFGKKCKTVKKKEGWPEFKDLKAQYGKYGKACKGVSKIMGK